MKPLRPQKYIYKLNSTYLDMRKYCVEINLKDIEQNSDMLISVGHSQLIKWIEELTNTQDNYLRADELRKEIKHLKRLGSTKENKKLISAKYDELYNLQFEPNLVSIQFDKKSHFDNCCEKLVINGKEFCRLYGTPGGLKMSTVLFINKELYKPVYERVTNGRDLSMLYTPAKLEAYMALTSSTSNAVLWPKMIVVSGTVVKFKSDVIEISDGIDSIDPIVKEVKDKEIEIEINDGCGLMSPEYSKKINYEINGLEETISGACARCAFLKGMLFTFDFKDFAQNVAHKTTVIDAWGHEQDVMDADVIITTSQLKLWNAYESYQSYLENCQKYGYEFRLTKISEELDESRNLNYQFTQSYYLSDESINELISPTVDEIKDIISLDPRKTVVYLAGANLNEDNINKADPIAQALMINQDLINDPYVRSRIEHMIQKKIRLAKISTIDVDGNFAPISGDPYAMCEDIFGMPVKGLLKAGEIYHQFWKDKNVEEVVCMRAPMCAHYNIVKQRISYDESAAYWYQYITDCIILNSWDTLRIAESGADCDGDILFTTNNKVLVDNHRKLPALDCQQRSAPKTMPTEEAIAQSNKKGFSNKVGSITNIGTAMLNLQSKFPQYSKEWNELEYRIICIQHYQQLTIDSVKGIKMTPMNKQWNNIGECMPSKDDELEIIANKEFNKRICANKKPYFFIYRYNTTKAKYNQFVKQFNEKLQQKYHITLDELLNSNSLSNELKKVKDRFFNKCPVDLSAGTVNRIAWMINDKFSDFEKIPYVAFDKELIKSGTLYSKSDYYKVKDVYIEYQNALSNLAVKNKKDEIDEDFMDKSMINALYKKKFDEACSNEFMLCDILIDLLYDKNNSKCVVWDMCAETIIKNLIAKSGGYVEFPEEVKEDEEFSCCRKKFKMKRVYLGDKIDGEI